MNRVRLTKEFGFEMAHALEGYDGACKHIHGHSYRLFVTVIGSPSKEESDPKFGMVLDFSILKGIVGKYIIDRYDHALILRESDLRKDFHSLLSSTYGKVEIVDYQPTCENMICRFAEMIKSELPSNISLHHIKLHETATSFAEWYQEDNI